MKYRKKPVIVEAIKWNDTPETFAKIINLEGKRKERIIWNTAGGWLLIPTLEGNMTADVNDWIIKGVKGELYSCKPDIFEQTYEPLGGN